MAILIFENLEFLEKENEVAVNFMKYFYFKIEKEELKRIADFKISKNSIEFEKMPEKSASNKFNILLSKKIIELRSKISGSKAVYIHKNSGIEAHINAQGEPLLYSNLIDLIKDLRKIKEVGVISMDTNGVLLNKKLVDELVDAGLTRFNLSLVALNPELAKKLAGTIYDVEKIKEIARYIAKKSNLL